MGFLTNIEQFLFEITKVGVLLKNKVMDFGKPYDFTKKKSFNELYNITTTSIYFGFSKAVT